MAKRVKEVGTSSGREGPSAKTLGPTKATPSRRKKEAPVERQYVGIDGYAISLATERAGDQVDGDGISLGNDDAMPKEGGDIEGAHRKTLGPGTVRDWQVGRKALA